MSDEEEPKKGIRADFWDKDSEDQLTKERGICMATDCHVRKVYKVLEACENRVYAKPYTAETCHEEVMDLMEAIDHCIKDTAFAKFF